MYESTGDANERRRAYAEGQGSEGQAQGSVVQRLSKYGVKVLPSGQRRSALQRQDHTEICASALPREAPERASVTAATRKQLLKELLLTNKSHSGFSSVLSSHTSREASCELQDAGWAMYPVEHAWMLSAVQGSYGTLLEYISEDPYLLSRKDFISGYTVLHWLAKRGQDETLLKLLTYAQRQELRVNVDVRGSGGLTPLHLASMHGHYMVIKLLVGAFGANVDAMDYNGKRAWQYLKGNAPLEMKELLGTWDEDYRHSWTRHVQKSAETQDTVAWGEGDGDARESSPFDRAKRRSSRFGSVRKLIQSFTSPGSVPM